MTVSKAWAWDKENDPIWLTPSEESYYISNRWNQLGYKSILDLGCGLGRHSIYFAKQGFNVSAFDLSEEGVNHLLNWALKEDLNINIKTGDMLDLSYENNSFDCIFAYYVISHTDTNGMVKILKEIDRVLKPNGEIFLTLCSKETWSFKDSEFPKLDENTVIKTDKGPEQGIPHFYVTLDDILRLFDKFDIQKIRHTDDCYFNGTKQNSKHYFVLAKHIVK